MTDVLIIGICFGALLAAFFTSLASIRPASVLQQGGYSVRRFFKWYFGRGNIQRRRLSLLAISLALLTALFDVCFSFLGAEWANAVSILPFAAVFVLYLCSEKKYALKVSGRPTPRFIRLNAAHDLLLLILSAGLGFGLSAASLAVGAEWFFLLRYVPVAILPVLIPFSLACAEWIMTLYEIPHNRRYIRRAKERLDGSACVKVGITGSFGKTSVKRYAEQLLSRKYRVVATPASYNTPMGIARTVFEKGTDCDFFLAEMGARKTGDIRELCELVSPTVGVITGICPQHIETFGSLEAIKREKGVLKEAVSTAILGRTAADLSGTALREGEDFSVSDLVLSTEGIAFTFCMEGERIPVKSSLLGRHAAEDLALAAALCRTLGMPLREIASAIGELRPVEHRLCKTEANGVVILDDSYNCNIEGAKDALETLRLFGGRKFAVTPGIVELGELEEEKNTELGGLLAGLDSVILVGETLVLPVKRGYLAAGGAEAAISVVPTLGAAQRLLSEQLREGDVVLFLNDLPDIYG